MKKLSIYLDTSVISYLDAKDIPEKMRDTITLWEDIRQGKYDVYVSDVTLEEINECGKPKRDVMFKYLSEIEYKTLSINIEAEELAKKIIEMGILKQKSYDDCVHIAIAVVNNCNYIVSWNFKHLVNIKTINGVRAITNLNGYRLIDLVPPTMLIQGDDYDG